MSEDKVHFHPCLRYEFCKGNSVTVVTKNICDVYSRGASKVRLTQLWFSKFRSGDFSLADKPRAGRPLKVNEDNLKAIIDDDARQNIREIALKIGVNQSSLVRHLHHMGMVSKYDIWVPHELSAANLMDRVSTCVSLNARQKH